MICCYQEDGGWEVWTNCFLGEHKDGRCIGVGKTKIQAMVAALQEIKEDLSLLTNELANELETKK